MRPFFLSAPRGHRFCLHIPAARGTARSGAILHIAPFAEELNKARRATTQAARAMAAHGWDVLQVDLLGCGDSSGDLADATWGAWQEDLDLATRWLVANVAPLRAVWGVRFGALLAAAALEREARGVALLMWQPIQSGRQHLTQWLRLRTAAEAAGSVAGRVSVDDLRSLLAVGKAVDVSGYTITSALASAIEAAELTLPTGSAGQVHWLESGAAGCLFPASETTVDQWRRAGVNVNARFIPGAAFWQTVEIEEAPQMASASLDALARLTTDALA